MLELNKQVNASIVGPGFIASVCKKLAFNQREAAEISGGWVMRLHDTKMERPIPPLVLPFRAGGFIEPPHNRDVA